MRTKCANFACLKMICQFGSICSVDRKDSADSWLESLDRYPLSRSRDLSHRRSSAMRKDVQLHTYNSRKAARQAWRRANLNDDWIVKPIDDGRWVIRYCGPSIFDRLPGRERKALEFLVGWLIKAAMEQRERTPLCVTTMRKPSA
jgi:hypothetical protein